jgi:glycosyltransferase involved in cell wall biosynthesis
MIQSAAVLSAHGELAAYCSPAVFSDSELDRLERRLPGPVSRLVVSQLRLRAAPKAVAADRIVRCATPTEVAYVLSLRMGTPRSVVSWLDHRQARAFDRGVSRVVHPGMDAVIGYQGTSVETFAIAGKKRVPRVLDYPIAHYEETERLLSEELKLVPAYAGTMQGATIETWRKRRYAREIAVAERIIMVSSYHQRTFEEAGIEPERLFMAHFGVDLERFSPGDRLQGGSENRPFRVLFCGQITQRKGISYLVDAFEKAELEQAELVFAGRPVGSPHPWIDRARVRHVGALARPQLVDIYRNADVIVLPSLIEGFPSTPLEGMACGLPAIVSEHTFGRDVIEDGIDGWVTPIRDSDAIAARLRQLYESPDLRLRMGEAARRKAESFSWSQYGEAVRSGIASLVGRARPPQGS